MSLARPVGHQFSLQFAHSSAIQPLIEPHAKQSRALFDSLNVIFTQAGIEDALFEQAVMIWVAMVFLVRTSSLFIPMPLACCSKSL
jgi:hypothetical protein